MAAGVLLRIENALEGSQVQSKAVKRHWLVPSKHSGGEHSVRLNGEGELSRASNANEDGNLVVNHHVSFTFEPMANKH